MHGLGADGHDFEPIVPMLGCPDVRFVFPHAPSLPVTINGGMVMPAWYDIRTLEPGEDREDESHIRVSAQRIEALVDRELARGIEPSKLVLAGFSQGGAMALHVGVRQRRALAGALVLSGYQLLPSRHDAEASSEARATPMLFGHGQYDPMVPLSLGRAACDTMRGWSSAEVQWHDFPIAHQVSPEEIEVVGAWLRARLG